MAASPAAWIAGLLMGGISLGILLFFQNRERPGPWILSAGILTIWAIIRLGFYSLISAAAWPAEPRYLQGTAVFGMLAVAILVLGAVDCLANIAVRRR